jgi:hypothetical protein
MDAKKVALKVCLVYPKVGMMAAMKAYLQVVLMAVETAEKSAVTTGA